MTRSARFRLSAVALTACLAFAGCGGGPNFDFTPPGNFTAALDGVCLGQAQAAAGAQVKAGQARTATDEAANLRFVATAVAASDEGFAGLEPPAEDAAAYARLLAARNSVAEWAELYAVTLDDGRPEAIVDARRELDAARGELWAAGGELGAPACAGQLSPAEERDVTDLVETVDTTSDPSKVCEGMVFESYVESAFGGVEECRRFQRDAGNTARSIDVVEVTGTDAVAATVDFRDVEGPFDGRPLRATLFPSEGRWLLWNVVELSDSTDRRAQARP